MTEQACYIIVPDPSQPPFIPSEMERGIRVYFKDGMTIPYWDNAEGALKYIKENNLHEKFGVVPSTMERLKKKIETLGIPIKLELMK